MKAAAAQTRAGRAAQRDAGVDVADHRGDRCGILRMHGRVVTEFEAVGGCLEMDGIERLVDAADVPLARRVAGAGVVVAADQEHVDARADGRGAKIGEGGECFGCAAGGCVEEIAEEENPGRGGFVDERGKTSEVGAGGEFGNRDARGTEGGGLAEVEIGDDERGGRRPVDRAIGEQTPRLAGPVDGDRAS